MTANLRNIASSRAGSPTGGTVLRDGTPMQNLIDREKREVSLRVMHDPEIYEMELRRIFMRNWILLGHESEIPKPGDYITRKLGEDPVILVRRKDGEIECLLNVCPHRGTLVARAGSGNANLFRCIYHGWMFNLDGSIRGVPYKDEMYGGCFDAENMSLKKARTSLFGGLIFVNWDPAAPSLDDYLGDFRFYLNLLFNRSTSGYEVLGTPQRWVVNANWKTASEQFGGDGYHAGQLHRSLGLLLGIDMNDKRSAQLHAPIVNTANGHNIVCFDMSMMYQAISGGRELSPMEKLQMVPPAGMTREDASKLAERFTSAELKMLADNPPSTGGMFPNVGLWNTNAQLADRSLAPFLSFRTHSPIGPDKFEFIMWTLVSRDADEALRDVIRRSTSFAQGAAGFVEGDDSEVWPGQSIAARGAYASSNITLKYWSEAGHRPPEGWPGGGRVNDDFWKDDSQWSWWNRYFETMANGA